MANLHCECQELKPKVETNSSFLVLHPPLGVDIVNTVGSHLKMEYFNWLVVVLSDRFEIKVTGFHLALVFTASLSAASFRSRKWC